MTIPWSTSDGNAIRYVLLVLWTRSCFDIIEWMGRIRDDTRVSSSVPGSGTGGEVCCWLLFQTASCLYFIRWAARSPDKGSGGHLSAPLLWPCRPTLRVQYELGLIEWSRLDPSSALYATFADLLLTMSGSVDSRHCPSTSSAELPPDVVVTSVHSIVISVSGCLSVCLSVCLLAYLKCHTSKFQQIFCTPCLWPYFGPYLVVVVVVVVVVYLHDNSVQNSRKNIRHVKQTGSSREVIKNL